VDKEAFLLSNISGHCQCSHDGVTVTHKKLRDQLLRDVVLLTHEQNETVSRVARGRPSAAAT
jgi:hypothetical protein